MTYFSRLTDIVTCNLSSLIAGTDDPAAALGSVISEIEQGIAGARRSVQSATASESRIRDEITVQQAEITRWHNTAKNYVDARQELQARQALMHKKEMEDLVAGLEQQLRSAMSTREMLTTTLYALQARHAEALRRKAELESGSSSEKSPVPARRESAPSGFVGIDSSREKEIDDELAALRRELGQ